MKNILRKNRKRKTLAVSQIISIVLSTIAFAYIIGSEFGVVSASVPTTGECIELSASSALGTGESWWEIKSNGVQCIQDHCSPTSYADGTVRDLNWFCGTHLGATKRAAICQGSPNLYTLKPASSNNPYRIACSTLAARVGATGAPPNQPTLEQRIASLINPSSIAGGTIAQQINRRINRVTGINNPVPENVAAPIVHVPSVNQLASGKLLSWKTGGYILKTAATAAVIYAGIKFVSNQIGFSPELGEAAARSATIGYLAVKIGIPILQRLKIVGAISGPVGWIVGAGIAILFFIATFKSTRYDSYTFTCYPWDAQLGGKDCEKCNSGDFPCTEYKCKSLGQACELENAGTTEELCIWKNRNDVNPPEIQAWTEALTTDYKYIPDTAISPPDRGVKIVPTNNNAGCVEAYTALSFGVKLNEAAKCKLDSANKQNFSEMRWFFDSSSTSRYNHSQTMSLPNIEALEADNITIENNGRISLYARCQDANGNANTGNFVFNFCVNKGPDNTAPNIITTSIINGMPIRFNVTSVDLSVYVNEPAECKWSKTDQSYNSMETNMSCSTSATQVNAQGLYRCSTTLTGLNDNVDNNFYFRCKDQPHLRITNESRRNVNSQSYKFTLKGTRSLVIDSVKPNGTIKDSTDVIKVTLEAKTSAGFHEGDSLCSYNGSGTSNQFNEFLNTGTHEHSQDLYLAEGDYIYNIQCTDLGGNSDTDTVSFRVESDSEAPIVVRAFHEGNYLKIVTNEEASCVYSNSNSLECNYDFKDGISMQSLENNKHQTSWDSDKTFYIKCKDEFGNSPMPDECSIIARPYAIK
ncbi:MAG: hypothetical protein NTW17_03115 [Candidatus Pacearchaeota archaeon]|nr:hypothetical protein [Candidatus Pacearchaeota archaeon]